MDSVESWVIGMLTTPEDDGDPHIIKVTCRLDAPDVADLDRLAKRLNLSRTAAATGLLTAAIQKASSLIEGYDENPHQLDMDEQAMHEARYERQREGELMNQQILEGVH